MAASIIGLVQQKGGCSKSCSTLHLGIGLAKQGKRVLVADNDPQSSLTISMGYQRPDELPVTLCDLMLKVLNDQHIAPDEGVLHHAEGIDLLPANITLAGMEVCLVNAMSRESVLKQALANYKADYDCILVDCGPSLGMLTINALAAADRLIIPVQPQFLSAKGLELLLQTVSKVRRQINPKLKIDGILLTLADERTNACKEITALLRETYGSKIKVFDTVIPRSTRVAEASVLGKSIYAHDPRCKVAEAYLKLTQEVLSLEKQRQRAKSELSR